MQLKRTRKKKIKIKQTRLLKSINYEFRDPQLFKVALTHRSCGSPNNERLEFLGDSILNCVITQDLYGRFPQAAEGKLSSLRAQLVKGDTLAEIAIDLELGDCILLGEGERKSGGFRRPSILADTVEAIIGAVHLDSGMENAKTLVHHLYSSRLKNISLKTTSKDSKTLLQEWLQARKKPLPKYTVVASTGDGHDQVFTVQCSISVCSEPTAADATNRKEAEKLAATLMLVKLEKNIRD